MKKTNMFPFDRFGCFNNRKGLTPPPQSGFTLIELMVTLAMVVILAIVAVPSYRSFVVKQQLTAASGDFMVSLLQARSEAVRLGKNVAIAPADGSTWTSGWNIFQDNDCTGTYSSANSGTNTLIISSLAMGGAVSVGTGSGKTNKSFALSTPYFAFAPSGFLSPYSCAYATALGNSKLWLTASEGDNIYDRAVIVSLAGRARVCVPSSADNCLGASN